VASTAVLPLLPEKPRYPELGAYPKYGPITVAARSKALLLLLLFI
jgi:hypothetical protein